MAGKQPLHGEVIPSIDHLIAQLITSLLGPS
jgi:hypothetical protein